MHVSLSPQLERFVSVKVAEGRYASASEVVRTALRLLEEQELRKEELRREVALGMEQLKRGEAHDGPSLLHAMRERLERRLNAEAPPK